MIEPAKWTRDPHHPHGTTTGRTHEASRSTAAGRCVKARADVEAPGIHPVCCPYCQTLFDLFAASWCTHLEGAPSKVCPQCARCLCEHPAYAEPHFWKEAPLGFRKQGFERLFLFYL